MSVLIPVRPDLPFQVMQVTLDGVPLSLEFRWNQREGSWYMAIRSEDEETTYAEGVKVVVDWSLAYRWPDVRTLLGKFMAIDTSGAHANPGLRDLGDRVQLVYIPRDESDEE